MWTSLIIVAVVFTIAIMWISYNYDNDILIFVVILLTIVFAFAILYCQSSAIVGDAEPYNFNIMGNVSTIYFNAEEGRYFAVFTNDWNPVKIFRKEYLDSDHVERFLSQYEEYEKFGNELKEIDLLGLKKE